MAEILENGQFAVSTWSLHRLLGATYPYGPDPDQERRAPGAIWDRQRPS
jgi:hypothetical protein